MPTQTTTAPSSSSTELSQLPFLLKLIDDPSPKVRRKIALRLRELGGFVWPEIEKRELELSPAQRRELQRIVAPPQRRAASRAVFTADNWLDWLRLPTEPQKLEAAYGWLACHRCGKQAGALLHQRLTDLAREYLAVSGTPDPEELSEFLFNDKGLHGADADEYYDPLNSDLLSVLETRRGIPISLVSIFILVGARLDIEIAGCNFPGHFLARAPLGNADAQHPEDLIFDCHNSGRILFPDEAEALRKTSPDEMQKPATAAEIISRVLRNLAVAHHVAAERSKTIFYLKLLAEVEAATS